MLKATTQRTGDYCGNYRHQIALLEADIVIRVNIGLAFLVRLEAADEGIKGLGIVFRDIKLNTGGVKSKHSSKGRVDCLTNGFGEIHHILEHQFDIRKEALFKASEKRSIRNLGKAAEIPSFLTNGKKEDEKGIGGDGKKRYKRPKG